MDALTAFNEWISLRFDRLTLSEKKIATYLMSSYEEAAFFSAAELAEWLEMSEARVVRLGVPLLMPTAIGEIPWPSKPSCRSQGVGVEGGKSCGHDDGGLQSRRRDGDGRLHHWSVLRVARPAGAQM